MTTRSMEGKVVVITGAGRGIGREIALLAAQHGAKVIVNDLGTAPDGEGSDASPAEQVAAEINESGGTACANIDDVSHPDSGGRMVEQALDVYGRLDCVVNNAGILRDRMFHRMSSDDFESVVKVHLLGSFYLSRAAATIFREQESGSFVHFTSASGLVGNFGQANYAAAKMGIVGLSKSIALDMSRYKVRSNCVCPFAWSRLIGMIPTETEAERQRVDRIKAMSAEKIAPLCIFLGSDLSRDVTGQIFVVRKNEIFLMSQPRPVRSVHRSEGWTVETIHDHMLPLFKASFYPLDRSADVFCWDPM